jgi:hypothetical protein
MARVRRKRLFPVALSLEACRDALDGVSLRYLRARIADGSLIAYSGPNNSVRVFVVDLVEHCRQHWPRYYGRNTK